MSYNKLFFNRVELDYDSSKIRVAPNFRCPVCNGRPEALLEETWNCNLNRSLEVNGAVAYTMPCCGNQINLYLAVHKERGSSNVMCRVDVEPIREDWWVNP